MSTWYRVFSLSGQEPDPVRLLEHLHEASLRVKSKFHGDEQGWFALEMTLAPNVSNVVLERFHVETDGIRQELNNWVAWLETCDYSLNHQELMNHVIRSQQMFTLRKPLDHSNEVLLEDTCTTVIRYVSDKTDGIYQVDGEGFFHPDSTLLLQEH